MVFNRLPCRNLSFSFMFIRLTLCFDVSSLIVGSVLRNSTPSLLKTEKKESTIPSQGCSRSPVENITENCKREETARVYSPVSTR